MKLDNESKNQILSLWEKRLRESSKEADAQESSCLRDHLPEFLDRMISALKRDQTLSDVKATDKLSRSHGDERAQIECYTVSQVLREYSILRVTVIEVLCSDGPIGVEDQIIMHGLIDEAEMIAGGQFSETRRLQAERLTQELQRSNEDLDRFAAIAAHDLRAPIATICSVVEAIKNEITIPNAEVEEYFAFVSSAARSVLLLIERLLTYASLGKSEQRKEEVNLNQVVDDVVAKLGKAITDSQAKILYKDLPTIKGDAAIVGQLFQNLIANSIKFKGPNTPVIEIRLEKEDEKQFTLSLKDNGIGFKSKQAEVIFEAFKRLNEAHKYEGSGLGLSTARRVVEVLGGKIWAESEVGKGAKFFFTISK
ncbi:MAG: ATP-binding protein [Bdellovibrionia bacterium]